MSPCLYRLATFRGASRKCRNVQASHQLVAKYTFVGAAPPPADNRWSAVNDCQSNSSQYTNFPPALLKQQASSPLISQHLQTEKLYYANYIQLPNFSTHTKAIILSTSVKTWKNTMLLQRCARGAHKDIGNLIHEQVLVSDSLCPYDSIRIISYQTAPP